MRKKDLILVGGGGHCSACLDVLSLLNLYNVVGIIEKNNFKLEKVHSVSVFKDQETVELSKIYKRQTYDEQKEWLLQNTSYFAGDVSDEFKPVEDVDDLA